MNENENKSLKNNNQAPESSVNGPFEKVSKWMKESITLKLLSIGLLILLMLIPVEMVQDLIRDRMYNQNNVEAELRSDWANAQQLSGPVLTIPFDRIIRSTSGKSKGEIIDRKRLVAQFLPEELDFDVEIANKVRHRGIYNVSLYSADATISGSFAPADLDFGYDEIEVKWEESMLSLGISDSRGIQEQVNLTWDGNQIPFSPGNVRTKLFSNGVQCKVPLEADQRVRFQIPLNLNGSSSLNLLPLGKTTRAHLHGDWPDPKYQGAFLPDEHSNSEAGFDAVWKVLDLNRSFPQRFINDPENLHQSAFGMSLFIPVNEYKKNMRSAKYAVLFITLTFVCFFFIQMINGLRIHFIQYLLVGLALCLFYVVLLSVSEILGFDRAYLIAAISIILQVCLFVKAITKSAKVSWGMFVGMSVLYAFVYGIIQLEEMSLLIGSIGLFIILGAVMYLSRKMNLEKVSSASGEDEF
jgi:inner membrane protein